jgi:hypothetical protein
VSPATTWLHSQAVVERQLSDVPDSEREPDAPAMRQVGNKVARLFDARSLFDQTLTET